MSMVAPDKLAGLAKRYLDLADADLVRAFESPSQISSSQNGISPGASSAAASIPLAFQKFSFEVPQPSTLHERHADSPSTGAKKTPQGVRHVGALVRAPGLQSLGLVRDGSGKLDPVDVLRPRSSYPSRLNHPMNQGVDEVDVAIGANLRQLRIHRGLSMEALGQVIGVTYQQVRKYETGSTRLSARNLFVLARFFGVEILVFFNGLDAPAPPPDDTAVRKKLARISRDRPEVGKALMNLAMALSSQER